MSYAGERADQDDAAARRAGRAIAKALDRDFAVVAVDWAAATADPSDGTVGDDVARALGAAALCSAIERLTALDVDVAVLAGDDVATVDGLLRARPAAEGRLFLLLSRGAEAYVVGPTGPRLLERRQASVDEAAALTAAAEALRAHLAAAGAPTELVLAPADRRIVRLAEDGGKDPARRARRDAAPRFGGGGLPAVAGAAALARGLAKEAGLAQASVTASPTHVEIGLTDELDALRYLVRNLLQRRGRPPEELLALAASFGAAPGRTAPDPAVMIPELRRATVVSVGEKGGDLPPRVHALGGGSAALLAVLEEQVARRGRRARAVFPTPADDPAWRFAVHGFDPFREREVETWLTVANGATGTRGALAEGSAISTPATFVAGVFGDGTGEPRFRQPVPAPDWLGLRLKIGDMRLTLSNGEVLDHERVLDMRSGVVYRFWRQRDGAGRTTAVRTARFASLDDRSVMAIRAEAVPEDFGGNLVWEGMIGVSHAGGPTRETVFEALPDAPGFVATSKGRNGGGHALAVTTNAAAGSPIARRVQQARDVIGGRLEPGEPATVDRVAAIAAARTRAPSPDVARRALARAEALGFDELLARHAAAWRERWRDADLVVEGDAEAQRARRV
jgi:kojibiose phosphorylase